MKDKTKSKIQTFEFNKHKKMKPFSGSFLSGLASMADEGISLKPQLNQDDDKEEDLTM